VSKDLDINATHIAVPIERISLVSVLPVIFEIQSSVDIPKDVSFWLNGKEVSTVDIAFVSSKVIHVVVPAYKLETKVSTIALYATSKAISARSLVLSSKASVGSDKVIQQIAKMLYTTPGSDVFTKDGLGLLSMTTRRVTDAASLLILLKDTLKTYVNEYNATTTTDDPKIRKAVATDVAWSDTGFSATITIVLSNEASKDFYIFASSDNIGVV
jgi:hypothetical protein